MLQVQHSVRRDFFGQSSQLRVQKQTVQHSRRHIAVRAEEKPVDAKIERLTADFAESQARTDYLFWHMILNCCSGQI